MRSVSIIMVRLCLIMSTGLFLLSATAQENSPFTRYGLGDMYNNSHVIGRSMGGLGAAYADGLNNNVGQSVNFNNPATYGHFYMVSFDLGLTIDSRTLRSENPSGKFTSNYFTPSYLAIGIPLKRTKNLGLAFGLRPVTRISYSINGFELIGGDSLATIYEGNGGLNQVFAGIGKKWGGLSVGFNTGYNFGRKEITTKKNFLNDTVFFYQSKSATSTNFNGTFLNGGFQYEIPLRKRQNTETKTTETYYMRLGATATLSQKLSATQDITRETYTQSVNGDVKIDSVFSTKDAKGKIEMPATYAGGITFHKTAANSRGIFELWSLGAEYTTTQWSKYRFYNQADPLVNSWQFKIGAQLSPDPISGRNYWSNVNYRAGFYMGKDYTNVDGKGLKQYGISLGAGFPIKRWNSYTSQFTVVNTAVQFGKRGSGVNNITENYVQLSLGFSLSDIWFTPRKYE